MPNTFSHQLAYTVNCFQITTNTSFTKKTTSKNTKKLDADNNFQIRRYLS